MAAESHALLSPSSSHRWINCTPSARLEENVPDEGSVFSREGTVAHALCECKLISLIVGDDSEILNSSPYYEQYCDSLHTIAEGHYFVDAEMEACSDEYVSIVWNKYQEALKNTPDARIFVERRLDFTQYIPESFGTADAIIIADGTMEVIDFKYGKGVEVSAIENPQMMIYALGAVAEYEVEYRIDNVRMAIVQPRKHNLSEYEISVSDLVTWAKGTLMPAAALAIKGAGDQKPGEWCRFCKVKATCSVLANQSISVYTQHEDKATITDKEMPAILALIPAIKSWCTAVEQYAIARAIDGAEFEGFKLVAGRAVRKVTDPSELASRMEEAGHEDVWKPRELKTITELESLVGKKLFAELSRGLIDKPEGKLTLVPLSDKREPLHVNTAAEDFKDIVNK